MKLFNHMTYIYLKILFAFMRMGEIENVIEDAETRRVDLS
jgi:hypothetical protein